MKAFKNSTFISTFLCFGIHTSHSDFIDPLFCFDGDFKSEHVWLTIYGLYVRSPLSYKIMAAIKVQGM